MECAGAGHDGQARKVTGEWSALNGGAPVNRLPAQRLS